MTQAKVKLASFEEYLAYSDETPLEGRFELVRGELVELPPESEPNNWLANYLQFLLVAANVAPLRLIKIHALELQVPVLQPNDAANRYPDLVVLRPEHLELTQRRLTITRNMPLGWWLRLSALAKPIETAIMSLNGLSMQPLECRSTG